MKKDECIRLICRFPEIYKGEEVLTPQQIYLKSGYEDFYAQIQNLEIEDELKNNPALVDEWILFTADKRWTPAWGISKVQDRYHVFHVQESGHTDTEEVFNSPFPACARMVRMEMEDFRRRQHTRWQTVLTSLLKLLTVSFKRLSVVC